MTPEEAVTRVRLAGHVVIVHRGQAFFNTTDETEAEKWRKLGAVLVPHYDDVEIANRRKKGRRTTQGWEVHLLGALEPIYAPDADGDDVLITNDVLLEAARVSG